MCISKIAIMFRMLKYICPIVLAAVLQACVRNDIPYPVVELSITSVSGEGFTCNASDIDAKNRTAVIHLDETSDMSEVVISEIGMTEGATADVDFPGTFDMRSELHVILELYQQYEWIIIAEQEISRAFRVEGQIGNAEIDVENRIVKVRVPDYLELKSLEILEMKLGPEGITTMDHSAGETLWFDTYGTVRVHYHDTDETWYLYVEPTDILVNISSAVPGTRVMWLSGSGVPDTDLGFRYRKSGESRWTDVADEDIEVTGGAMEAYVGGLTPETEYEVQAYSGENVSESVSLTTGSEVQLHNMSFDDWYQNGKIWYPNADAAHYVWDSANPGSAELGFSPTNPTSDVAVSGDGKQAAKLETLFAVIKLAAGNLYTGKFGGLVGLSGAHLDWGVEFSERPTALKGWYKYLPEIIGDADGAYAGLKGKLDTCQIQILLADWDAPFTVNTVEGHFVDFDGEDILAYGKFEPKVSQDMDEYEEFLIPLEYRDLTRTPTYIVITACASKYGDFFIGGVGSTLYVDEFELLYDKVPEDLQQ